MGAAADEYTAMGAVTFSEYDISRLVRDALKSVQVDGSDYKVLVDELEELRNLMQGDKHLQPDETAYLVTSLKAISGAASYVDDVHHHSLLVSIYHMSMWNYGPDVMDALVEFFVSLAASSGKYVELCLDMLVRNFIPPRDFFEILKQPRGLAKKELVLSRVHSALKRIADLVPLAPARLEQLVRERMPTAYKDETEIVVYVENMLRLESGDMGELVGSSMLLELVNKLIDLDVEIGWDEILLDDPSKGIFEMELEDMARSLDETEIDMEEPPREYSGRKVLLGNAVAEKLDSLMVLTFEHLQYCAESGRLVEVFETFLQSFQSTVLNAYKSKFAQFVMFYACSLDPENCGTQFVCRLVDIFKSNVYPQDWRMSAVAYLASYLSRAKFLSASYVTTVLESLVDWCIKYCEIQGGDCNPKYHRLFYAGCQAIMYVLCFRMRSILALPRLKSQLFTMPIETILKHPLNPLEVCLPSIVQEFLRQAKAAHVFRTSGTFVFNDLLESELSRAFGGLERLDSFFPFDPYLLKKSDRFIRPNFIYWSMVRPTYDEDDDDDDDNDDIDDDKASISDEDEAEDGIASGRGPMSFDDDEFNLSLNKMSITPRNSLANRFGNEAHGRMQMPSRIRPSTSPESL